MICSASDRCVDYDRRTELPALAEDGPLCQGCVLAGERAVPALVRDYQDLADELGLSMGVRSDGQPQGSAELRVPIRLDVEALQREIWWVLTAWEEVLRDVDRLGDAGPVRRAHWSARPPAVAEGAAVQRAAVIVGPRVRKLAAVEGREMWCYPPVEGWSDVTGAQGVIDVVRLHRRAFVLLGLTRPEPERCQGVPCRECDLLALYREPGEDTVRCGDCGYRYQADEYRRWIGLLAESVRSREVA